MLFKKQTFLLIIVMTIIVLIVEGLTLTILYNTSFEKQRDQLIATVRSQAALITSVANFDSVHSQDDHKDGAKAATLSQVRDAYHNFKGFGKSGELVIGTLNGNEIKFLIRSRHLPKENESPIIMSGEKAVLMQQALSKKSGTIIAKDYSGKRVLGAYEYIKSLHYGLVVKIDLDELRTPFIQVGIISVIVAIILIIIGAFIFRQITSPMVRKLQESDDYNRMLFETSPLGMALTDMDGTLIDMNSAYAHIIGRSVEETKLLTYWDITPEEFADQEVQQLESLKKIGRYGPYEKEYIHKDGSRVPVSLLGHIVERHGKEYIWSSVENISQRKEIEYNISLNEARLNEAQRLAKVGSWELDLISGELIWSDEIFYIFEIDKNKFEASYDAFLNAIHPEDRDTVNAAYTNSLETRQAYEIVHRLQMEDGIIKHVRETCESHFDDEHKPLRSVGTVQDITELVNVENNIEQSRAHFETMFQSMSDSIVLVDVDRNITLVNKSVTDLFGYTENELIGSETKLLYAFPEDFNKAGAAVYNVDAKGNPLPYEVTYKRKDGTVFYGETSGSKIISGDGSILGFLGIIRDVTERKKIESELTEHREHLEVLIEERTYELKNAQEELVRKGRLATLGQLTATVSHELRNPLGAMRPSLYVVKKKSDETDERVQNAIERIDRNIDRCDRIIDELLDFTRITELNLETVLLDKWLESVIDDQIIPEGIQVEKDFSLNDIKIEFDASRLHRAIINVFENGCHAMMDDNQQVVNNQNAHLKIKTEKKDNRVEIIISDVGSGISKEVLEKIFEPLFSTKGFGVGLGMPTVRQIIEQHGGGIEIESEEGKGTSVTLWLPMSEQEN